MSDHEVIIEYLQLLSLDQNSLTTATTYWLQDAIVAYRKGLADAAAANAAANATTADANNATRNASAAAAKPLRSLPLLTHIERQLPAVSLMDANVSYPLSRARSMAAAAEDFASLIAAVLQVYGVHSRIAVVCSANVPAVAHDAARPSQSDSGGGDAPGDGSASTPAAAADGPSSASGDLDAAMAACRSAPSLGAPTCEEAAEAAFSGLKKRGRCRTIVEARLGEQPPEKAYAGHPLPSPPLASSLLPSHPFPFHPRTLSHPLAPPRATSQVSRPRSWQRGSPTTARQSELPGRSSRARRPSGAVQTTRTSLVSPDGACPR